MKRFLPVVILLMPLAAFAGGRGGAYYNMEGLKKLKEKKYSEAGNYFIKAISCNPSAKHYYNNAAVAFMNQGNYKEAYRYLADCLSIDRNNVKALSNMAITSFHLFKFGEAYNYYMRVRKSNPAYAEIRFKKKRVIKRIRYLSKKYPGNTSLLKMLEYIDN